MTTPVPRVLIIAGPNGAGKTTFARQYLPREAGCPAFVNADLIASGLSPFEPESVQIHAGRLMLQEVERHFQAGESFAFETTLAGRGYLQSIKRWRAAGYQIKLIFLALGSEEEAIARVNERVRQGGHGIPEDVIRRRFRAGRQKFKDLYQSIVDSWVMYDNSGESPVVLAWQENTND